MPAELKQILDDWGLVGLVLTAILVYRQPILAALARTTRDPLVEALTKQNEHFADNNRLFQALGPSLGKLDANTADAAATLQDILEVQRSIKDELIRGGRK